jgi:hypothetical protein
MDPSDRHSEPLSESLSLSTQKVAQLISLLTAAAEVGARRKTLKNAREAAETEQQAEQVRRQQRDLHDQARAAWAAAHDPAWLNQADLIQTAQAWSAAVTYGDDDPVAASAVRKCEERLRILHPYAMARYDRLRSEGTGPLDAMSETAWMFARPPHARPGQPGTRHGIEAAGRPDTPPAASPGSMQADGDAAADLYSRGQEIVRRLQERARRERGSGIGLAELETILEETTTLPGEMISRLARARDEEQQAGAAEQARAARLHNAGRAKPGTERTGQLDKARRNANTADASRARALEDRTAAQIAADSFPCTAADGIRASVNGSLAQSSPAVSRSPGARELQRTAPAR